MIGFESDLLAREVWRVPPAVVYTFDGTFRQLHGYAVKRTVLTDQGNAVYAADLVVRE